MYAGSCVDIIGKNYMSIPSRSLRVKTSDSDHSKFFCCKIEKKTKFWWRYAPQNYKIIPCDKVIIFLWLLPNLLWLLLERKDKDWPLVKGCEFYSKFDSVKVISIFQFSIWFWSEMLQKAAEAKLVRKAQRQAAMDAAKLAKRERGYLRLMLLISLIGLSVTQVRV